MDRVCLSQYPDHPLFKKLCDVDTGLVYHIEPKPEVSMSKGYVGITKTSLGKRLSSHLAVNSKCVALRNAIKKHGIHNFTIRVVEDNVIEEELLQREVYWVSLLDTRANGYNCTDGGESKAHRGATSNQTKSDFGDLPLALFQAQAQAPRDWRKRNLSQSCCHYVVGFLSC